MKNFRIKRMIAAVAVLLAVTVCAACARRSANDARTASNTAAVIDNAVRRQGDAAANAAGQGAAAETVGAAPAQNTAETVSAEPAQNTAETTAAVPGSWEDGTVLLVYAPLDSAETKDEALPELSFDTTGNISVDRETGIATYDDGIVKFSWDITRYYVTVPEGEPPALTWVHDGCHITFRVFRHRGVAEDLSDYAMNNMKEYLEQQDDPYWWTRVYAICVDTYFAKDGCFGILTGYVDTIFADRYGRCNLLTAHSFSDGKNTALLTVRVEGSRDYVSVYEEAMYVDHEYQPVLESMFEDVIASFSFSEAE
ncbi:MAG: hypothetical protein IKI15_03915 [Lachnospiraceae bacterium]|nr:hypothetical protein [Lachnospiraceae bacterium]